MMIPQAALPKRPTHLRSAHTQTGTETRRLGALPHRPNRISWLVLSSEPALVFDINGV